MLTATLHDGSTIEIHVIGDGPTVLLPVNPVPAEGSKAEELSKWGADPALGQTLIKGLSDAFRVVAFPYEDHIFQNPKEHTLNADNITKDFLSVADAAGAGKFALYGYSWLALCGMQVALRSDRVSALVMGGFPPISGPYAEMLAVTRATRDLSKPSAKEVVQPVIEAPTASESSSKTWDASSGDVDWSTCAVTLNEAQTGQFVTLYEGLQGFDDHAVQSQLNCSRLCFAGSDDDIEYSERWGGVSVSIGKIIMREQEHLETFGWDVSVLNGLDHTQAMQPAAVLPILRPWLEQMHTL